MPTRLVRLLAAAALALPLTSSAAFAQEGIKVADFMGTRSYSLSASTMPVRRGVPSTITIAKNLIDLVPENDVVVTGATRGSNVLRGKNGGGTGFITFSITPSSGATPGNDVTVKVGLTDVFKFEIVYRGLINGPPSFSPSSPSTMTFGTTWSMNVTGVDLFGVRGSIGGSAAFARCHTMTVANRADGTGYVMTVTPQSGNTVSPTSATTCGAFLWDNEPAYTLSHTGTNSQDPPSFGTSSGTRTFPIPNYQPKQPPPPTCTSNPNLPQPTLVAPVNGTVINASTQSPYRLTIRWSEAGITPPLGEWLLTITPLDRFGQPIVINAKTYTITATSTVKDLSFPQSYVLVVRAKNCGQSAPSSDPARIQIRSQ